MNKELETKISERLETLIQNKIEHNPDKYYIRTTSGGFGYEGAAKNESVYDEEQAKSDVIDDIYDWIEDYQMISLFKELLRSV